MNDTITIASPTGLFADSPKFVLWYRPSTGRAAWEAVAAGSTERQCLDQIETSGKRHGRWYILPNGREP